MFIAAAEFAYARIMRCGSATRAASSGVQRVDQVAAVRRQAERVGRRRAGLGVLPGDPGHLDHRHRRAVGQHDRHLQQRARVGEQVALGVVGERLGAVAALQQERAALADLGEPDPQLVDLVGRDDRRDVVENLADRGDLVHVRPGRHLHPGQGPPAVEAERLVLGGVGGRAGRLEGRVADPGVTELVPLIACRESTKAGHPASRPVPRPSQGVADGTESRPNWTQPSATGCTWTDTARSLRS